MPSFFLLRVSLARTSSTFRCKRKQVKYIYSYLLNLTHTPQRGKTGRSKKEKILLKKERQMRVTKRKRKRKKELVVCIRALGPFSIQLCPKINPQPTTTVGPTFRNRPRWAARCFAHEKSTRGPYLSCEDRCLFFFILEVSNKKKKTEPSACIVG